MNQDKMVEILSELVPEEGVIKDFIHGIDLFRITDSTPRSPQNYQPCIIILAQGQKKVFIADESFIYDPLNYLVVSVPLPLECETTASLEKPLLGITVKIDMAIISEIMFEIDEDKPYDFKSTPKGIYSGIMDNNLIDACTRLLNVLSSPLDRQFLGSLIVKEIIYRILNSKKGEALRFLAFRNQRFYKIARILEKIHRSYSEKFDISSLAKEAGMSISAFHSSFKAITNCSPLQYIKNVKLHKARLLIIEEGINAFETSSRVGYESPSQFSREYKRLFKITPGKDAI